MRVFVAGATGAIGRPLVPRLVAAGHDVTGTTRSDDRADGLRAAGAEAVVLDALDGDAMRTAVAAARPEVVMHQLTALPERLDPRDPATYEATNRLRGEGTRILLDAALAAGARRFVAQSVAFMYEQAGPRVKSEEDPLINRGAPARVLELEHAVAEADRIEGVVLRYGYFYGPGTYYGEGGSATADVRSGRLPIVGRGEGVFSFVHVDDAAEATVAAVERGAPGAYNVVDDEPAPMRDWLPAFAAAAGADPPPTVGSESANAKVMTGMRGASNAKAKRELGWEPRHRSWRTGFRSSLA